MCLLLVAVDTMVGPCEDRWLVTVDARIDALGLACRLYDGSRLFDCTTARRRLSLGLYDGSEEAVAWLVRRLGGGGGCRLACTTARRRLSMKRRSCR
jgi:hypothetical protein